MMQLLLSTLLNPWLHTISALLTPFALRLLPMFRNSSPSPQHIHKQQALPAIVVPPLRTPVSALLALYALYTLYILTLARPPNLFTTLRLPLNAPQSAIRAALLRPNDYYSPPSTSSTTAAAKGSAAVRELPPALEKLLARLASSDTRTILVRCVHTYIYTHFSLSLSLILHSLPHPP
jgi:hypothetical protein